MNRINLPKHKHPLYTVPWVRKCGYCFRSGGYHKDGYRCYECDMFFHKECVESSLEINHPSHPQHPLYLTLQEGNKDKWCELCGESLYYTFYYCSLCNFFLDTACARNPPPDTIEFSIVHEHPLALQKHVYHGTCNFCEEKYCSRYLYKCSQCNLKFHLECCNVPREMFHPCHPEHPIRFITRDEHHFSDGICRLCEKEFKKNFYYCSICKFSIDVACARDPPQLSILYTKAHEHQLNLLPRSISFTCDACGKNGTRSPYACLQCYFMIHQSCIDLPEIINVNRHEHRLYKCFHLSPGNWLCGVCHQEVDWSYGAYSCSVCSNYAIHSWCAIQYDVWDKLELKGIPEEIEDIEPFKRIHGNVISHFSHKEHYLKLNEGNIVLDGRIRCAACVYPIYFQAFYSCVQCDFILHETCANLPRKKRHVYHNKPLTLICGDMRRFYCSSGCSGYSVGFRYTDFTSFNIDVTCGALSESIIHDSHPCPLYYIYGERKACVACNKSEVYSSFSCEDCRFTICKECVVLPKTTKHWYDEHLLSLCYEKDMSEENWCDICENTIDIKFWFYKCNDCCITFHTKCVLGDFSRLMPGRSITINGSTYEVMQTSPGFLPRCRMCHSQRAVPIVLKRFIRQEYIFVCSSWCLLLSGSY